MRPMAEVAFVCIVVIVAFVLAMRRAPLWAWALAAAIAALAWQSGVLEGDVSRPGTGWALLAWIPAIVLGLLSVPSLRRTWVVAPTFRVIKTTLPKVSDTEQQALDAGTIGFD